MNDVIDFLEDAHFVEAGEGRHYESRQIGAIVTTPKDEEFDLEQADMVIVGCADCSGEERGAGFSNAPNAVREELYKMYYWHSGISIADIGNVRQGATPADTRFALRAVLKEIQDAGKVAILIGGGHDLMLEQYKVFRAAQKSVVATCADMLIDLDETEEVNASGFLMDMLTGTPNFVSHYSHIGFQSYYVHPQMLETLDKLRFDFFRLGMVRDNIEEMEPVLRNTNLFGFDMSAIRYSDAPANINGSPNGLNGEDACRLMRFAGMSSELTSVGVFGFNDKYDRDGMTAKLMAQMLWYFVDGYRIRLREAQLDEDDEFLVFSVVFSDIDTEFLKSKRTNRWWMRLPDGKLVPCSYSDYRVASAGDIPERWLREQERLS